jgi:hypothetical protein
VKRAYLLVLIAAALLLSGAASRSDEKHQHQATHHQSAAKNQSAYSPQPPTIIVEPAPVKIIQPAPAAEKQTTKQKWYQRPSITDWGVLFVTGVYALISLGLLKATWRQAQFAQDTLAETRKTANATEVAANATRDAVQVSKSTVRPYLWVRKVETGDTLSKRMGPEFTDVPASANCYVQNLGKGPAFITEVVARLKFSSAPLPLPPAFNDCINVLALLPVVTESDTYQLPIRFVEGVSSQDAQRMSDINNPTERFSCYGIIRYRDVFGESYCTTLGFSRQWRTSDGVTFQWVWPPWPPYNKQT